MAGNYLFAIIIRSKLLKIDFWENLDLYGVHNLKHMFEHSKDWRYWMIIVQSDLENSARERGRGTHEYMLIIFRLNTCHNYVKYEYSM